MRSKGNKRNIIWKEEVEEERVLVRGESNE